MDCTELPVLDAVKSGLERPPEQGADGDEQPPAWRTRLEARCSLVHGDGVLDEYCDGPISFQEAGYACEVHGALENYL